MKTHTTLLLTVTLVSLLTACSGTKQLEEKKKATDAQTSPRKTTVETNSPTVYPATEITYHLDTMQRAEKTMPMANASLSRSALVADSQVASTPLIN
ncbi:hypothetical protein [Desulfogranum marinum]|uniref:hypothetical protein n=1 Tax=Desulfogranum marinum TaxID=453220 RepID=UPI001966660A|nr:hypothetical protein [Desulfogranum marinum]MBM9515133.1 hypothetical protein [Desulfogranum marinum]